MAGSPKPRPARPAQITSMMPDAPPAPPAIDSHAHLNHPRLSRKLGQVLARARAAGVTQMIVVGYDLPSSEAAMKLAESADGLWATVGVHPHDASGVGADTIETLRDLSLSERVVAIGETGLDFYRDLSPRETQEGSFRRHLDLAVELRLPIVIHCREAQERLLMILREYASEGLTLIWHSFDGTPAHAAVALSLGAFLGLNGMLTYPRNVHLVEIAAAVPLDRLLLETDCPYLAPEPRRSRDNEPANLPIIAEASAAARRIPAADVVRATTANARRAFARRAASP